MPNFEQIPKNGNNKNEPFRPGSARKMTPEELEEFAEDLTELERTQGHKQDFTPQEDIDIEEDDLDLDLDKED